MRGLKRLPTELGYKQLTFLSLGQPAATTVIQMTTTELADFIESFVGMKVKPHTAMFWALRLAKFAEADGAIVEAKELRRRAELTAQG